MSRSFPPDVVVLDSDSLLHARFARGKASPRLVTAKSYRLPEGTFEAGMVTPQLVNEAALSDTLRRLRMETGKWEKVSLLLPDSWFRINNVEMPSLPTRESEARDVVRWSLKRTLPIAPEELRVSHTVLSRSAQGAKVLILSALEATLSAIERVFAAAGFEVALIEPLGLNLWNAIAVRESDTNADRLLVYMRDEDFTTAVFRGAQPLFIRSRTLRRDRTAEQEIRLSANYLRDSFSVDTFASCYVAGERGADVHATLADEFHTEVRSVRFRDFAEGAPSAGIDAVEGWDAELTACTGVFTG
jgi:Tfp pilus assembly PilM family ATPase